MVLVVLGVVLVVLGVVLRQCSEQMFGTDSVRNSVPSQLREQVSKPVVIVFPSVFRKLNENPRGWRLVRVLEDGMFSLDV